MKKIEQPHSTAKNGLEALDKYKESPSEYSCILTGKPFQTNSRALRGWHAHLPADISMPVMDGLESTRRVREVERIKQFRPCKIIALTGLSSADVQQDAHASGVDLFLTRPVTLKRVISALEASGVR
jgi:CheY-like chemotaxis protein